MGVAAWACRRQLVLTEVHVVLQRSEQRLQHCPGKKRPGEAGLGDSAFFWVAAGVEAGAVGGGGRREGSSTKPSAGGW